MKNFVVGIFVLMSWTIFAQNRINYSQYMHNHQIFNPAYMDESSHVGGSMLYRNQWMGFQGSPKTIIANGFYNVKQHGFNVQFLNDNITIFKHLEAGISYSYSIKLDRNTRMSFGIKATYNQQSANYGSLTYFDAGDQALSGTIRKIGVNFGGGVFVRNPNWHVGVGAPYLFNNAAIDATTSMFSDIQYNHFFLSGGYKFVDNPLMVFYPTALLKWTKGSPLAMGIDMNLIWRHRLWASLGYRVDNTIILSAGIIFLDNFKAVYSYDLGLGRVNLYGGMTHELSIGYGLELYRSSFTKRKFTTKKMGMKKKARYK